MQPVDPYNEIKHVIERELGHASTLQAQLFAGTGGCQAEQLNACFQDVSEQLRALESAVRSMVENPAKFQLTPTTAYTRQVEVETLRFQLSDMMQQFEEMHPSAGVNGTEQRNNALRNHSSMRQPAAPPIRHSKVVQQHPLRRGAADAAAVTGSVGSSQRPSDVAHSTAAATAATASSSSSKGLRGISKLPAANGPSIHQPHSQLRANQPQQPQQHPSSREDDTQGGWDTYAGVVQQQLMQQQDQELEHIALHVDRIKHTGQLLHDELEEQSLLLDGLHQDTDTSTMRLRGLRSKVADVMKRSRQDRQLCWILVLSVVLVVLTLVALA